MKKPEEKIRFLAVRIWCSNVTRRVKWLLKMIKRLIWNRGIFLLWCRVYIREDEFHYSLNTDYLAMSVMSGDGITRYLESLSRRRDIAHKRSLN